MVGKEDWEKEDWVGMAKVEDMGAGVEMEEVGSEGMEEQVGEKVVQADNALLPQILNRVRTYRCCMYQQS